MAKLNNKGYTLVELLAAMIIIGVVMGVTIPNITGIAAQNKITAYAEDAKKFKNAVEYAIRGDDTVKKPVSNGQCVIANLRYIHGSDFDTAPNGGKYLMDKSFVVMVKKDNRYYYYVQLVEEYSVSGSNNYKGYKLVEYADLEGDAYLDKMTEGVSISSFVNIDFTAEKDVIKSLLPSSVGCSTLVEVYYVA